MWKKLIQYLTKSTPVEREQDIMLDHEYDGIRELGNVLPPWWLWLLYFTIVFSLIYLVKYHITSDWSSAKEYTEEVTMAQADVDAYLKKNGLDINENNVKLVSDEAALAEGKKVFDANCVVCHRQDGGGLVGPNLTDDKWIHGADIKNLFTTIKNGVPAKGMLTWEGKLSPTQMQNVASYILVKLHGTNPKNPFNYPYDPK